MRHILFQENSSYPIAIIIKSTALREKDLRTEYVDHLVNQSIPEQEIIAFSLEYDSGSKVSAATKKSYLSKLLPALQSLGTETLLVADASYFKTLTGETKAEIHYGYVLPCAIPTFEHLNVVLVPNYQSFFYNPSLTEKRDMGITTLVNHYKGTHVELGSNIIHSATYPTSFKEIATWLEDLTHYHMLACDIEAYSLQFWKTGIATIAFAWDEHNGIAFRVTEAVKPLLTQFFEQYHGHIIWHNANYDMKIIVNDLWMNTLLDEVGKQRGIEIMCRNFHDTKLITYLATNSTAGNNLSLKHQAHEFAGNYAQEDINDITLIPEPELLKYNLIDALATFYVYKKHYPTMIQDDQENIYNEIFKPSVKVILQMELTGMPLNMDKVYEARSELQNIVIDALDQINSFPLIDQMLDELTRIKWEKDYQTRKAKAKNPDKIKPKPLSTYMVDFREVFNPNSNQQIQYLMYTLLGLPVIDLTDGKDPAVGGKTLKKLKNHTTDPKVHELIDALRTYYDAAKVLDTFIKAFIENSVQKENGWYYLHGNFNLGGTVSGRLSSSRPNLQNTPSGSTFAKLVKQCFQAPPGYLFVGADFASLEDRISALTTKDPQKLRVYLDGYDGHSLRAFTYYNDQITGIDETPDSINSIAEKYPELRQESKAPTFLLTYGGSYIGLMNNLGWSEEKAKTIEARYHELYHVSDEWVQSKLQEASQLGYVTCAFGLKVRTPLLKQSILNKGNTPYEAQAEGRTAGNALGQSWGLLNNRAGIELQELTFQSPYRYEIMPVAHIHDAQYFIVKDDVAVVHWLNTNIGNCMKWQDHPDIYHPEVGLGGELDIFYPSWANAYTLPNGASKEEILKICKQ